MKRIHIKEVFETMQKKDNNGKSIPFSFRYAKLNGELKYYHDCRVSSIHFKGATFNATVGNARRPKTFRKILITEFNKMKVYI